VAACTASWERRDGSVKTADVVPYWRSELATTVTHNKHTATLKSTVLTLQRKSYHAGYVRLCEGLWNEAGSSVSE